MKKHRIIAGALALVVLLGGTVLAASGSQSDPLVSLSYLNGTYWSSLSGQVKEAVEKATQPAYDAALSKVQKGQPSVGAVGNSLSAQTGTMGAQVELSAGSGLIWMAGDGTVRSGVLVDVTAGQETRSGGKLTVGRRYIAAERAAISVTSQNASWMAEGEWKQTDGNPNPLPFTDVPPDSWYYDAVCYAVEHGLFQGVTDTQFKPSGTMTRGMVTTVLYRLAGEPDVVYEPLFPDVPENRWYAEGVVWAGKNGVVSGFGDGTFLPNHSISRQQFAVILYNYMGMDWTVGDELSQFADGGGVASWARSAMSWAVSTGIINGSNGKLRPYDTATRAEVAAMFQRFLTWMG